ncbi:MAG: DNA-directed RNA polymerase subunit beta [Acetilactobacillus jinshanensis]
MQIGLASPDKIRSWSYGEVKKPETINYRTLKPEKEGLFDERIFGPTKDWQCSCGKYKRIRYRGIICDRCGVEVTRSNVRRERMGHIELAAPVTHIWYFKGIPSRMGLVLDMSPRALEEIIYFAAYVVTNPGDTPLEKKQLLTEREYREKKNEYGNRFEAQIGAQAVETLLNDVDLKKESAHLEKVLKTAGGQKRTRAIRRLDILNAFLKSGNKLSWMVLHVIPVIPPALRPMVQLEGGRFATSDLNDLYRRVINRNNRLKRLLALHAPGIIVQNEKRMLQEAVDALIDNGRRGRPVSGPGNRPLKSLSHMLKGKQGRFRQNLLGKRVDYSGRSVIDVGPHLKFNQLGLPVPMALELFKPYLMHALVKRGIASNVKSAKRKIHNRDDDIYDVLADVIKGHPILLNRAPTLHRLSIQAFYPVLVSGKSIRFHPLCCTAYNADFDGDQVALHVPLSDEAQAEARTLMLSSTHILAPRDGTPIITPSQDIIIGNYYITLEERHREGEGTIFNDANEAILAYQNGYVQWHSRVGIRVASMPKKPFTPQQRKEILVTTVGKIILNTTYEPDFPFLNEPTKRNLRGHLPDKYFLKPGENIFHYLKNSKLIPPFKKGMISDIIAENYRRYHIAKTAVIADNLKHWGYENSMKSGLSFAIPDIVDLKEKPYIIKAGKKKKDLVTKQYQMGLITNQERYERVVDVWSKAKDRIQQKIGDHFDPENDIFMMSDSGARGNISNFTQMAGMRGLMAEPNGKVMELPITANFREGLSIQQMFISTHGARKGMTDTALKTANSGYLTRRLVDVAQDCIVREHDCGTDRGLKVRALMNGGELLEPLYERILGRVAMKEVKNPKTGKFIVRHNQMIDEKKASEIVNAGVKEVEIRSALTCHTVHGVCAMCYGRNLTTGKLVEVGEAVGTVAAQAIGEPGTQLTMRNFHTGGVAGNADITQGLPRVQEVFEARHPKGRAIISKVTGTVKLIEENPAENVREVTVKGKSDTQKYKIPMDQKLVVKEGDHVHRGAPLNVGSIDPKEMLQVTNMIETANYMLGEIQKVYRMQGVDLNDKHPELIIRQLMRKVRIMKPGDTKLLPGSLMDVNDFRKANAKYVISGKIPATARPVLLGLTKAALESKSFLSAASFQETTRVLTDAAIRGKNDPLVGLKENVIVGKLIPAGTGMHRYRNIQMKEDKPVETDY